jgi:hypothetical protein
MDEEFDAIVEGLDIDVDIESIREELAATAEAELYRKPVRAKRPDWRIWLAIVGIAILPASLLISAIARWPLPAAFIVLATAACVGAAIYLMWRLPRHGPADDDWPDDGAVL